MAAIAGWVILDQSLGARDIVAIGLVTAASIVVVRAAPRRRLKPDILARRALAEDRARPC